MRQLLRMTLRSRWMIWPLVLALAGCSLPGPYQTYSPGTPPTPVSTPTALTVYGGTTTTPENEMNLADQALIEPPPIAPLPAAPAPASTLRIAICYSRLWNSADSVRGAATQACGAGSAARIVSQDTDLNACFLLTPTHAVFTCGP
jgi:hypothetical protein